MLTRIISCMNCGITGEIEVYSLNAHDWSAKIFRHVGHNPFSGHMHYQCPSCEMVLLVDPMSVLGDGVISTFTCPPAQKMRWRRQRASLFQRLIQNQ